MDPNQKPLASAAPLPRKKGRACLWIALTLGLLLAACFTVGTVLVLLSPTEPEQAVAPPRSTRTPRATLERATPITEPTSNPDELIELGYRSMVVGLMDKYADAFATMKRATDTPSLYFDESYRREFDGALATLRSNYETLQITEPPPRFAEAHIQFLAGAKDLSESADLMVGAWATLDPDLLEQSFAKIETGMSKFGPAVESVKAISP